MPNNVDFIQQKIVFFSRVTTGQSEADVRHVRLGQEWRTFGIRVQGHAQVSAVIFLSDRLFCFEESKRVLYFVSKFLKS